MSTTDDLLELKNPTVDLESPAPPPNTDEPREEPPVSLDADSGDRGGEESDDPRIITSPLETIKYIQSLLADVYTDAGDGGTIVRELVQNADDAGGRRAVFVVAETGWKEARNPLLRGPGLLVANDGPFSKLDHLGLHRSLGGSKGEEAGKVGRFGVGMKSVFHLAEAFLYVGASEGRELGGALNPWAGTGEAERADPVNPAWDTLRRGRDQALLTKAGETLLGGFREGFVLWVPFRQDGHLNRDPDGQFGLSDGRPSPAAVRSWFARTDALVVLLAQCGSLRSLEAAVTDSPERLGAREQLALVSRPGQRWVGRPQGDDAEASRRRFEGQIERVHGRSRPETVSVAGVEAVGHPELRRLREHPDWPKDHSWVDGKLRFYPRKARAHAAITVLRHPRRTEAGCLRLRWAVFLPLDDDPSPAPSSRVVESLPVPGAAHDWEVLLHGYFGPSQDRRAIPGVTPSDKENPEESRVRWNRLLRDRLLLPSLPDALEAELNRASTTEAQAVTEALRRSRLVREHNAAVVAERALVPKIAADGVVWTTVSASTPVHAVPRWRSAPQAVRRRFAEAVRGEAGAVFVDDAAPRLSHPEQPWPVVWLRALLEATESESFARPAELMWWAEVAEAVARSGGDAAVGELASWLARQIGAGALRPAERGRDPEVRDLLRKGWRRLFGALPPGRWLEAPQASLSAVEELAEAGELGAGLMVLPLGEGHREETSRPILAEVDRVLMAVGGRLSEGSAKDARAWLMLAEALIAARPRGRFDNALLDLPLIRATRLPEDTEEAWSIRDLEVAPGRVFCAGKVQDPKVATRLLAEALGEPVWLVARTPDEWTLPAPEATELAEAVERCPRLSPEPERRRGLLERLVADSMAEAITDELRALLAGQAVEQNAPLVYVEGGRDARDRVRAADLLLGLVGGPPRIPTELLRNLPRRWIETLRVEPVDRGQLQLLLERCLSRSVAWDRLGDSDAVHLLRSLHSTEPERARAWWKMGLHRSPSGRRISVPDPDRVARGGAKVQLPPGLLDDVLILEPDEELRACYEKVHPLDGEVVLLLVLRGEACWRHAGFIAQALQGRPQLTGEAADALKTRRWLPVRDGEGVAPNRVLLLPEAVEQAVAPFASRGLLGDYCLETQLALPDGLKLRGLLGGSARPDQLRRLAAAIDREKLEAHRDLVVLPLEPEDPRLEDWVSWGLDTPLPGQHTGWRLLREARTALDRKGEGLDERKTAAILALAGALCGSMDGEALRALLLPVCGARPPRQSSAWRFFHGLCLDRRDDPVFFSSVLPHLWVPTRDGAWHPSTEVARARYGPAPRHLLDGPLAEPLRSWLESLSVEAGDQPEKRPEIVANASDLEAYVEPWREVVAPSVTGAFLFVLAEAGVAGLHSAVESRLGTGTPLEVHREELGLDSRTDTRVTVFLERMMKGTLWAENLLGKSVEMEALAEHENLFAIEPSCKKVHAQARWTVTLRELPATAMEPGARDAMVAATVVDLLEKIFRVDKERARGWWSKWGQGSQVDVAPVRASIRARLPLTLQQLDVRGHAVLAAALRKAEIAQRRREQKPSAATDAAERRALEALGSLVSDDPEARSFLVAQVRSKIRSFGYEPASILLELTQNADDAVAQAVEIAEATDRVFPQEAQRLLIRVVERPNERRLDFIHYGRPINDDGGASFPEGEERQWDQDLYFMMLMNLSAKPGEDPRQPGADATTGRFGLGFKSVHLVSDRPLVVSGFIGFEIMGGLLPVERSVSDIDDRPPTVAGQRPTLIRLSLDEPDSVDPMFARFDLARALIPVFARQLRELVVEGRPHPGLVRVDLVPVDGVDGWDISRGEVEVPGLGWTRILRYRPRGQADTSALAIAVKDGLPARLPEEVPFLWTTLPTSEGWACGYAVNGPFKLDPGRSHVALEHEATLATARRLGQALAKGLIELHDAVVTGPLDFVADPDRFVSRLWSLLTRGLDAEDSLRRKFLRTLHGDTRGVWGWMRARAVVPSQLPAPFEPLLPPLGPEQQLVLADPEEFDAATCEVLATVDPIVDRLRHLPVVSSEIAARLTPVLGDGPERLRLQKLVDDVLRGWRDRLDPPAVIALAPLTAAPVVDRLARARGPLCWASRIKARARDGQFRPLRRLILDLEGTSQEELLLLGFAPDAAVLASDYEAAGCPREALAMFREGLAFPPSELLEWLVAASSAQEKVAALTYLTEGAKAQHLLLELRDRARRPPWLQSSKALRGLLDGTTLSKEDRASLLARLFPETTERSAPMEEPPRPLQARLARAQQKSFFERLKRWWDDEPVRRQVTVQHAREIWPSFLGEDIGAQLEAESRDQWLALFVLGSCWSFGRTKPAQHRAFLEFLHERDWWPTLTEPLDKVAWMNILDDWLEPATLELDRAAWMALFPTVYQLSRHLDGYRRLLVTASRRGADSMHSLRQLLSPRVDPALLGAGRAFDVPPMPLGIGAHWVVRELFRLGVIHGEHLHPYAWLPSKQVVDFLEPLGLDIGCAETNEQKSVAIHRLMRRELGAGCDFHGCFDLPLREVAGSGHLKRQLGYET